MKVLPGGWVGAVARVDSPNCDARPPGCAIELLVLHCISLPPGLYGGGNVERLFTNRLDTAAHPAFAPLAGEAEVSILADTAKAHERDAANSWREPQRIRTTATKTILTKDRLPFEFPALSLTVLEICPKK